LRAAIQNCWIGRSLFRHFTYAGLSDVEVYPETFTTTDLGTANDVFMIERTLRDCVQQHLLAEPIAARWFAELSERNATNQFFGSLTLYMVRGRKR
jgi:hypothetical protein